MNIEILSIGTEILLGDILNTNAQFLSRELSSLGFNVYYQSVVGDNEKRLLEVLKIGFSRCDIIITTGGLGPTQDDLTKKTVSNFFNKKLILDKDSVDHIQYFLGKKNIEKSDVNLSQAYFPEGSIILDNPNGTANAMILSIDNKTIILLPGPPNEMEPLFFNEVVPYLKKISNSVIVSKVLHFCGIGEGTLSSEVSDIINSGTNPTVAPYAKDLDVILRITAKADTEEKALALIEPVENKIRSKVNKYIYAQGNESLQGIISNLLVNNNLTISTNESITGGLIANTLLSYDNSSDFFVKSLIHPLDKYSYCTLDTDSKNMLLNLNNEILNLTQSNIAISTIGSTNYSNKDKKIAACNFLVCICVENSTTFFNFNLQGNIYKIQKRATLTILHELRKTLLYKLNC